MQGSENVAVGAGFQMSVCLAMKPELASRAILEVKKTYFRSVITARIVKWRANPWFLALGVELFAVLRLSLWN